MELTYECPACQAVNRLDDVETRATAQCRCGATRALNLAATDGGEVHACPWCVTEDLYVQKDFPHGLGLLIVAIGFLVSTVFWYYYRPVPALGVLLATAALDLVLFYLVPDVTICYRCLGQLRGRGTNPGERFGPFDLAVGERYRQERLRIEELRRRAPGDSPSPSSPLA